jgi:hypothetical protein
VNLYGFVGNTPTVFTDPLGCSPFDNYFKIVDAIDQASIDCNCHASIVKRLAALRDAIGRNNKALQRVLSDVQENFDSIKDKYKGRFENLDRVALAERLMSKITGDKALIGPALVELKNQVAFDQTTKALNRTSDVLAIGESLSRRDATDLVLSVFNLLPDTTIAFGPSYYLKAYRGAKKGVETIAPDVFDKRAKLLGVQCALSEDSGLEILPTLENMFKADLLGD